MALSWRDSTVVLVLGAALLLTACGGGGGDATADVGTAGGSPETISPNPGNPVTPTPPAGDSAPANAAPTISGAPAASVVAGQMYSFQPAASDSNGDSLTFAVADLPAWASFDTATGKLSGTPTTADSGKSGSVLISVTDGRSAPVSMAAFTVDVLQVGVEALTLSWDMPQETAGISAYRIHIGTQTKSYTNVVTIENPTVTTYVVEGLVAGAHYIAMTSVDGQGNESAYSEEIVFTM